MFFFSWYFYWCRIWYLTEGVWELWKQISGIFPIATCLLADHLWTKRWHELVGILYRIYQLSKSRWRCKWDVAIKYIFFIGVYYQVSLTNQVWISCSQWIDNFKKFAGSYEVTKNFWCQQRWETDNFFILLFDSDFSSLLVLLSLYGLFCSDLKQRKPRRSKRRYWKMWRKELKPVEMTSNARLRKSLLKLRIR